MKLSKALRQYRGHKGSLAVRLLLYGAAVFTIGLLLFLIAYILVKGIPNLTPELFAWKYTSENVSMLPSIINTLLMTGLTLLLAVPIGVGAAVYMTEYAKTGSKLVKVVRITTETLQGIPSIVYGLFGFLFFVIACGWDYSLLSGVCTMAIMVLPLIMRTTEEALLAVPGTYRGGQLWPGCREAADDFHHCTAQCRAGDPFWRDPGSGAYRGRNRCSDLYRRHLCGSAEGSVLVHPNLVGAHVRTAERRALHQPGIRHGSGAAGGSHRHQLSVRGCGKKICRRRK